jgi:hypothetical protein
MSFQQYRLVPVPAHLHFPCECEPWVAGLLGGRPLTRDEPWPERVDREHLRKGLEWHAIEPVLYHRARELGVLDTLPAWLRAILQQSYYRWTALNLAQEAELVRLVQALHGAGVAVILLKGAALLRSVYGQIGLRPMVDIDLLVHAADFERVRAVLTRNGYREHPSPRRWECEHHVKFSGPGTQAPGLLLEVHWRLSDKADLADRLPLADLWRRAEPAGAPYRGAAQVFDLCDTVLHVTLHIAEHAGLAQLRRLADLHLLASRLSGSEGSWLTLAERAVLYDLHLVLAAAFQETTCWFGTQVPEHFWRMLAAGLPPSLFAERAYAQCRLREQFTFQIEELLAQRSWPGRIRYVAATLFPSPDFIRRRFRLRHTALIPPYYLVRLARGFGAVTRYLTARLLAPFRK